MEYNELEIDAAGGPVMGIPGSEGRASGPRAPTISAVIISCNEADIIEPCVESVVSWVNEILVVDMHSIDGTREIVQRYGARLIDHERLTYVEPARNFALSQASCDWIIMLDPDERVPKELARELRHIAAWDIDVVLVPRQQVMFGKVVQSPGASDGAHPRFFRRGAFSWPPEVHSLPDLSGLRCYTIPARWGELSMLHDTWRSVAVVLDKIVRYAPQDVDRRRARGEQFSLGILLKATFGGLLNQMIDGRAYEDGMAGLLTALYWSVYHMTIYAALWEAEGKAEQFDAQIQCWGRRLAPIGRFGRTIYRAARWYRSATNQWRW